MRSGIVSLILAGVLVLSAGCASHREAAPAPGAGGWGASERESRFQAAAAISGTAERDQAFASVALRAACAGDGHMTGKCLNAMSGSPVRDDAGYKCAAALAEAGWMKQAVAVAQLIGDSTVRDRALARIAEHSPLPPEPE